MYDWIDDLSVFPYQGDRLARNHGRMLAEADCTPEEAEMAVKNCKYPPEGIRSAGGGRWRFWAGADYPKYANDEILVIVQIEQGGAGDSVAAPTAKKILEALFPQPKPPASTTTTPAPPPSR